MKKIKVFTFIMGVLQVMAAFAADGSGSHGGGTHYCPQGLTEVYDVYEGKKRYRLKFNESASTIDEVLETSLAKVRQHGVFLYVQMKTIVDHLRNPNNFILDSHINISPVYDANILLTDKGCCL